MNSGSSTICDWRWIFLRKIWAIEKSKSPTYSKIRIRLYIILWFGFEETFDIIDWCGMDGTEIVWSDCININLHFWRRITKLGRENNKITLLILSLFKKGIMIWNFYLPLFRCLVDLQEFQKKKIYTISRFWKTRFTKTTVGLHLQRCLWHQINMS